MELESILREMSDEIPSATDVTDVSGLSYVIDIMEGVLGYDKRLCIYAQDAEHLPHQLRKLYDALRHLQAVWYFLSDIANDGLLSVFYNGSMIDIEQTKSELQVWDDTLFKCFSEAQVNASKLLDHAPDINFVTANPGINPFEVLGDENLAEIEKIEDQIESVRGTTWDRAVAMYHEALV